MQITLPRGELKDTVAGLTKIVNGKTTLPITLAGQSSRYQSASLILGEIRLLVPWVI
jgi:hypothetical protein